MNQQIRVPISLPEEVCSALQYLGDPVLLDVTVTYTFIDILTYRYTHAYN